jgi:uncharacterized protein (DUF3084 family)
MPQATPSSRAFPSLLLGLLLGVIALSWFAHRATHGVWDQLAQKLTGRELTITDQAPAVIASIQRLQRLETVNYSMDKIVEGAKESTYLPDFLAGDRLLLVVHGQVIAGVDLSKLQPSDVIIDTTSKVHSVRVKMPQPEIFIATLDNAGTHVYSRATGLLVPEDSNLESETRQKAIEEVKQAALDNGILNKARDNAKSTLTTLLQSLGFQQISIN